MKRDGLSPALRDARARLRAGLTAALLAGTVLAGPAGAQVIAVDPPRPSDRPEDLRLISPDATPRAVARTPRPHPRPANPIELALPEIDAASPAEAFDEALDAAGFELASGAPEQPAAPDPAGSGAGMVAADHDAQEAAPGGHAVAPPVPLAAGDDPPPAAQPAPQPAEPLPPGVTPPALHLEDYRAADFLADRTRLANAYTGAADPAAKASAAMDMATFYLAHQMRPEGRSILAALDVTALAPAQAARHVALDTAFRLMDGEAMETGSAVLASGAQAWPDRPLWAALAGYRAGDPALVAETLPEALEQLDHTPRQFSREVLLPLLDAAIGAGQWNMSGAIAERIAGRPELRDSAEYDFLLGKASAASGQKEAAFDAYARAAAKSGEAAQRARLALADIGIAAGGASLKQTADMLGSVRYDWRGGPLELGLLDRLARTEDRLGNAPAALRWYGQILSLFAGSPEAAHAEERADILLTRVYEDGGAGKIDIGTFLTLHRNIAPDYLRIAGFDRAAEKLGHRLLSLGATAAAAEEFAAIGKGLADGKAAGLWPVTVERETEIRLDEAEALIAGGQVPASLSLLAPAAPGTLSAPTERRLAMLRAEALWASGALDELAREPVGSDPGTSEMRRIAAARFAQGDWSKAAELYRALWHDHPRDFGFADATQLLLAAHHAGDEQLATAVADAFPDLSAEQGWQVIARTILAEPESLRPLRDQNIERRMARTERAVTQLRDLQTVSSTEAAVPPGGTPATP